MRREGLSRKKAAVLVAGSRSFDDPDMFGREMDKLRRKYDIKVVITGDATGADSMVERWVSYRLGVGVTIRIHYANWKKHKHAAGPIRNGEMVEDLLSQGRMKKIAVFFWDGQSKGTLDCLKKCRRAKVKRKVVKYRS